jgi:hypothetical protein
MAYSNWAFGCGKGKSDGSLIAEVNLYGKERIKTMAQAGKLNVKISTRVAEAAS